MGTLYIVSTPIGNLKDITLRALAILKSVDYILCEDTRITGKLLKTYGIEKRIVSFNEFNEDTKAPSVLADLEKGVTIALVSDAGSPLISDPGYKLVREAILREIKVETIPGPSSVIAALTVSGLPPDKFLFIGYLPKKGVKREKVLKDISSMIQIIKLSVIIYESPYRLLKTLTSISEIFGDIEVVVCRELTKLHEEVRREKVSGSINYFNKIKPKGEFTIVF